MSEDQAKKLQEGLQAITSILCTPPAPDFTAANALGGSGWFQRRGGEGDSDSGERQSRPA